MRDFKRILAWQKSHQLTLAIYKASASFPQSEMYGLTSQMRRASASIPANIAEGCGRESKAELIRFLQISSGSAAELEYHLLLAHDLAYLPAPLYEQLNSQIIEIKRMIYAFSQKLKADG